MAFRQNITLSERQENITGRIFFLIFLVLSVFFVVCLLVFPYLLNGRFSSFLPDAVIYFRVLSEFKIGLGTDARSGSKNFLPFEFDRNLNLASYGLCTGALRKCKSFRLFSKIR